MAKVTKKKENTNKLNKAYKYRIYPNDKQEILINKTIGCARFIYNHLLNDRINYYKETGYTLKKEVSEYKKDFPFLKEVDGLALSNAKLNLEQAFSNFFDKKLKAKYPRFHKKGKNDTYTTNRVVDKKGHSNIRIEENGIRLPKLGVVKAKLHRKIGDNETIKSCTISKKSGKYYISILVEYDKSKITVVQPSEASKDKAIGFDYSSPFFYVDSEGNKAGYAKYYRKSQKKLAKAQRRLSKRLHSIENKNKDKDKKENKTNNSNITTSDTNNNTNNNGNINTKSKTRSKNYYKQLIRVQKINEHIANQRKDFIYKKVHELIEKYDIFCFEDLNLSNMKRTLKLGKSTSDNGFGMFRDHLEKKCALNGKLFVKIDKWFPSTKTCHCCGFKNDDITLDTKEWVCPKCGTYHLRDVNAAINIRNEGLRMLLEAS